MTLIYLLRHAESTANQAGVLAGRIPGIGLSKKGRQSSIRIAKALRSQNFNKIYVSPLQRCLETINPYLAISRKRAVKNELFVEMDYGKWSGRKLSDLRREKLWKLIQLKPSRVTFPDGESFNSAARRIKRGLDSIARSHPKGRVLVVSHGDPIKIAIQLALDGDLDLFQKFVIDPGSLTIIDWPSGAVLGVNLPPSSLKPVKEKGTSPSLKNRRVLGGGTNVTSHI
jgi:probable phosphoglycerate mutase